MRRKYGELQLVKVVLPLLLGMCSSALNYFNPIICNPGTSLVAPFGLTRTLRPCPG